MNKLGREQGLIDAFKKLKTETQAAEKAMADAKTKAAELGKELKDTESPTKKQQAAFEKARKAARDAAEAYQTNAVGLQQLRGKMQEAGISTSALAAHQIRLRKEQEQAAAKSNELARSIKATGDAAKKPFPDPTPKLKEGLSQSRKLADDLRSEMARLLTAAALGKFVKDSTQAVRTAEASFRGLEAVANHTGVGIGRAFQEAQKLAADGLLTVSDASKSLQNLLSRGYNLDQAVETINRLKDAAAFNRTANLSMTEAVLSATEGLKNENSTLVDNAGVTKNVAKMWEEYAKQHGLAVNELTQAQKIQAEYNGILKETEAQAGNAQKALGGFEGQVATLNKSINELETGLGAALIPALTNLAEGGKYVVNEWIKPFLGGIEILAIKSAAVAESMDDFWSFMTAGSFKEGMQAFDRMNQNFAIADEMAAQVVERYEGGLIPAAQELGKAAKESGDKVQQRARPRLRRPPSRWLQRSPKRATRARKPGPTSRRR
jgi:plasmid stabilization system protein ParE